MLYGLGGVLKGLSKQRSRGNMSVNGNLTKTAALFWDRPLSPESRTILHI